LAALAEDAALLSPAELAAVRHAMFHLADALETEASLDTLQTAAKALAVATEEFAARRMNASIHRALAGRALDSLA